MSNAPAILSSDRVILPRGTIGVLGSGQLGRMFALKARRMGYRVHTYSPDADSPTGQVADKEVSAGYDDLDQVMAFAKDVDVVTFEFENVPSATTEAVAQHVPVRPGGEILHTTQNRLREKRFLRQQGFPCAPFAEVDSLDTLMSALEKIGVPAVLKTAGWGYDGKGQAKINSLDDAETAWNSVGAAHCIVEKFITFTHEASVVAARSLDGHIVHYGLMENTHKNHILDITLSPARLPKEVADDAIIIAQGILEALDVVGVMCVEFFVMDGEDLLVNELAPRPHNSGHVTFDNSVTCQFEQQLRAICGLPLGSTKITRPGAMANLLGDLWEKGEPDWAAALAIPNVKLHLYGKNTPRPGRKMGHLTALAEDVETAYAQVKAARDALTK